MASCCAGSESNITRMAGVTQLDQPMEAWLCEPFCCSLIVPDASMTTGSAKLTLRGHAL